MQLIAYKLYIYYIKYMQILQNKFCMGINTLFVTGTIWAKSNIRSYTSLFDSNFALTGYLPYMVGHIGLYFRNLSKNLSLFQ